MRAQATLHDREVTDVRRSIAERYLGRGAAERYVVERAAKPGVLLQLSAEHPRVWDLTRILPQ